MEYPLEELSDDQFEKLVNTICQEILGSGVISFSKGKDGGKDGSFTGIANKFPSEKSPWKGQFIIQAKHTNISNASCAERDFMNIIKSEIKKIIKLKSDNKIDNYLLFTNRKYSGIKGENIKDVIIKETGIQNVAILGKESINEYLNSFKNIVKQYGLNSIKFNFEFSDEEIKEIIYIFKRQLPLINKGIKGKEKKYDFKYIIKSEKNKKNKLSEEYYKDQILNKSLSEFEKIDSFLSNPINSELKEYYYDTASELDEIICIQRDKFENFENIFNYIYKYICDGDSSIKGSKRHIKTFLHYMYFECLIGKK